MEEEVELKDVTLNVNEADDDEAKKKNENPKNVITNEAQINGFAYSSTKNYDPLPVPIVIGNHHHHHNQSCCCCCWDSPHTINSVNNPDDKDCCGDCDCDCGDCDCDCGDCDCGDCNCNCGDC